MDLAGNIAAAAVDGSFAVYGKAASYVPPGGGEPVPCCVILDIRDGNARPEDGSPPVGQGMLEVRVTEIAQPEFEGVFTITDSGKAWQVASRPLPGDADGYFWRMWVE
jgi:hypothetical protein